MPLDALYARVCSYIYVRHRNLRGEGGACSPAEYEEDHLIGAISTPVLDNEQRAQVGTLYKSNPFNAKKLGAKRVYLELRS